MVTDFAKILNCKERVHCAQCLVDPEWRSRMGAPSPCPFGMTQAEDALVTLPAMAVSFAGAVVREGISRVSGNKPLPVEESDRRMGICKACEFYDPDNVKCTKCKCFLIVKTKWRTQKCPEGRW